MSKHTQRIQSAFSAGKYDGINGRDRAKNQKFQTVYDAGWFEGRNASTSELPVQIAYGYGRRSKVIRGIV